MATKAAQSPKGTPILDSILDAAIAKRLEVALTSFEKLLTARIAAVSGTAKPAQTAARRTTTTRSAAKPAPAAPKTTTRSGSAKQKEAARIAAGAKLLKCNSCNGDGLWGQKKDGTFGDCFDCFGTGKMTRERSGELKARRAAAQAS